MAFPISVAAAKLKAIAATAHADLKNSSLTFYLGDLAYRELSQIPAKLSLNSKPTEKPATLLPSSILGIHVLQDGQMQRDKIALVKDGEEVLGALTVRIGG